MNKPFIALIIVSLFASSACYAQLGEAPVPKAKAPEMSGPSLEETTQWITEKYKKERLEPETGTRYDGAKYANYPYIDVSFDDCKMRVIERTQRHLNGVILPSKAAEEYYLIPLAEVDENTIKAYSYQDKAFYVNFKSIGERPVFHEASGAVISKGFATEEQMLGLLKKIGSTIDGQEVIHGRNFASLGRIPNFELTERVAAAFKHAVKLCQAKAVQEKQKSAQEKVEKVKSQPKEIF